MTPNWKTKLQENGRPEYFFWAAVVCSLFLVFQAPASFPEGAEAAVAVAAQTPSENPFDTVEISAKAAYVFDMRTGNTLFAKNAHEPLPIASITKLMTAVTALSFVPETTYISIDAEDIEEEGDSGLKVGERFLLRDLLKLMLLESSNDGAVAVSSEIGGILATSTQTESQNRLLFVKKMNELADIRGFNSMYFGNESGLDIDTERAGALGTAAEAAGLLAFSLEKFPSVFTETRFQELLLPSENGGTHDAENTNTEVRDFPLLLASKTGYTDLAGGNLVIAFNAGFSRPVVIAILGSTETGRFSDAKTLVWKTLEFLQNQ